MSVVLAFGLGSDGQLGGGFESDEKYDKISMVIPRGIKIIQVHLENIELLEVEYV